MSLIYTALFGVGSIVGLVISAAAVPSLSKKYGTKRLFAAVNLINIFPNLLLFALYVKYPQNMTNIPQTVAMFVLTLIIGSCVSISSTVQTLIISQAVDLEEKISGNRPDALFFSAQTFIVKIGTGLSSLAASIGVRFCLQFRLFEGSGSEVLKPREAIKHSARGPGRNVAFCAYSVNSAQNRPSLFLRRGMSASPSCRRARMKR